MAYAGIDYGLGTTNIDTATGIRYGVISQHSVNADAFFEEQELDYGDASCPKCGTMALEYDRDKHESYESGNGCADYACEQCAYVFDSSEAFPEEANGWHIKDDEYVIVDCLQSDAMVIKSPYYTLAPFCSPCVPGAGDLNSAGDGVKTYCLGHDWFDGGKAPYPVYSVATGEQVAA